MLLSDEGNKEDARRWVLRVRYPTGPDLSIPLQVMASLKKIEGRLKKAPRRVPRKRPNSDVGAPGPSRPRAAAGAPPAVGLAAVNEDDENDIRLLLRASENKFRRMSPDMRKLKIKEYLLKGYIEN